MLACLAPRWSQPVAPAARTIEAEEGSQAVLGPRLGLGRLPLRPGSRGSATIASISLHSVLAADNAQVTKSWWSSGALHSLADPTVPSMSLWPFDSVLSTLP